MSFLKIIIIFLMSFLTYSAHADSNKVVGTIKTVLCYPPNGCQTVILEEDHSKKVIRIDINETNSKILKTLINDDDPEFKKNRSQLIGAKISIEKFQYERNKKDSIRLTNKEQIKLLEKPQKIAPYKEDVQKIKTQNIIATVTKDYGMIDGETVIDLVDLDSKKYLGISCGTPCYDLSLASRLVHKKVKATIETKETTYRENGQVHKEIIPEIVRLKTIK